MKTFYFPEQRGFIAVLRIRNYYFISGSYMEGHFGSGSGSCLRGHFGSGSLSVKFSWNFTFKVWMYIKRSLTVCAKIDFLCWKWCFYHCNCLSRGLILNDNFGSGSYLSGSFGSGSWIVKVSNTCGSGSGSATLVQSSMFPTRCHPYYKCNAEK